jgi:flagellar biosynthesis protein FlhF
MHIKRFEAPTLDAALAQVKRELGPDALILSTRTRRRGHGAFGLLSRTTVEVQAALERAAPAGSAERARDPEPRVSAQGSPVERTGLEASLRELRRELAELRERDAVQDEIRRELRELRGALEGLARRDEAGEDPRVRALAAAGLEWSQAVSLVEEWRRARAEDGSVQLEDVLRRRLESRLAAPRVDRAARPRIFVGAPGVGKTTTLAKLAARNEEGERDVVLVSMDPLRIGAEAQLRGYAERLASPFVEATTAEELPAIAARFARHALLVDTAGRGRGGSDGLEPLRALRRVMGRRASIELVLDATTSPAIQAAQLDRFAALEPDRLILTKVDECDSPGALARLLLDVEGPPVSWLGDGQRVPEDLRVAEPGFFVQALAGEAA